MRSDAFTLADELSLDEIIAYLEAEPDERWWAGPTFRSPDGTQHCVLSHIHDRWGPLAMEWFEARWSTSYVIGRVNDGEHPAYRQSTPKARCLAFLHALRDGREDDTPTSMERCASALPISLWNGGVHAY